MKSISKKMTFFTVMLVVISLLVATFASVAIIYTTTKSLSEQTLTETATVAASRVSWELKAMQNVVIQAGCNPKLSSAVYSKSQKQAEVDTIAENFGLDRGTVIDMDGVATNGNEYSDRQYFKDAMEGKTTITEPMIGRSNGKLSVIIAAPIWKNGELNTEVVGCIYFVPDEEFLNDIVRDIKVNENGAAYMIDKNGNTIADIDMQLVRDGENIQKIAEENTSYTALAQAHEKMEAGETGFTQYTSDGMTKFIGYAPIPNTNGWSIAVTAHSDDYMVHCFKGFIILAIICAASAVVGGIIAGVISRKIGKPIKLCAERIEKLSEGDLRSPVPMVKSHDEVKILAKSAAKVVNEQNAMISDIGNILSNMAQGNFDVHSKDADNTYRGDYKVLIESVRDINKKLNDTLSQISIAGDQVSSGSEQVSAGAQSLAQGATEQAASVEELAATIQNINAHIGATSQDCQKGRQLVDETAEYIGAANEKMHNLTAAMQEINDASTEIGKIIQTIEDIAFQTNILALNAAVEAARVGEAGKGFAVVADEVRNLAGKSADAAHDTTVLIERAVAAVENGNNITNETAQAVSEVEARSGGVSDIVNKIAAASLEQSDMVKQVNIGVEQISNVVQTNSATAEESAAASQELSAQAQTLQKLVSRFTFREE
mgnify:FL=1